MSNFISVHGKCTNCDYTRFGIQLTVFDKDGDPKTDYPVKLTTYDSELSHYLEQFTNLDFDEIPEFDFPVKVFAKAFIKDGQTKAFPVFNILSDFDITPQIV